MCLCVDAGFVFILKAFYSFVLYAQHPSKTCPTGVPAKVGSLSYNILKCFNYLIYRHADTHLPSCFCLLAAAAAAAFVLQRAHGSQCRETSAQTQSVFSRNSFTALPIFPHICARTMHTATYLLRHAHSYTCPPYLPPSLSHCHTFNSLQRSLFWCTHFSRSRIALDIQPCVAASVCVCVCEGVI